jgi:hypothetical protein
MSNIFRTNPKRLGEFLVNSGIVNQKQIEEALREQKKSHLLLGEIG